ncbi:MAG: CpXC domain-containing protein [Eggerthellaceae bacterium]|nr:CpXC domain-containing protein [Eggerthellaceae bacterium]
MDAWSYIASTRDAAAREKLLQGKLFKYTCPVCGTTTTMAHNCIYHDTERNTFLLYSTRREAQAECEHTLDELVRKAADANGHDPASYQKRIVFTTFEFCEKARILADGYDDRVIELMKVAIKRGMLEDGIIGARDILIYERTMEDTGGVSFVVTGEIPGDVVGVPQGYTYLKDQWEEVLDQLTDEYRFDAAWANAFLP